MRISIIGYSASGKSTLAKTLGEILNIPVLHLDKVNFLPNWIERDKSESKKIVEDFINNNPEFIIDGVYSKFAFELRMKLSDKIIFLDFDRITCLFQAFQRYNKYKGKVRDSMTEGCYEKLDWDFIKWILFDGRNEERINRYNKIIEEYKDKIIILKNRKEVDDFVEKIKINKTF
jgi:adenylate kinase family enzyme